MNQAANLTDVPETMLSHWIRHPIEVHNATFLSPRGFKCWLIPWSRKYLGALINKAPSICYIDFPD